MVFEIKSGRRVDRILEIFGGPHLAKCLRNVSAVQISRTIAERREAARQIRRATWPELMRSMHRDMRPSQCAMRDPHWKLSGSQS